MANIVDNFINVPNQKEEDFWTGSIIEHIRELAYTGKPTGIFNPSDSGNRILDKIYFKNMPLDLRSTLADTEVNFKGLKLSVPLYLGDMSFGALSGNPNIAIARAAEITKTFAGTGEGGLLPEIRDNRRIYVQWASARFGVDYKTINSGSGIVIKIGQGAKPGIGGHLPAGKVTEKISRARRIPENIDAISPAPHHDIYSIEDLSQRIEALKIATGKPVFVKVAATNYIPYIVTGIARSGADGVIIDGQGAGTGATPEVIRDNLGIPIELAVAASHDALVRENLRDKFRIIAAGRVTGALDAAKLYALGADVVSMGTAILISMGCIMVRKCNLGFCPTALTNKIDGKRIYDVDFGVNNIVNFITGFRLELAGILDNLGFNSIKELTGRKDLLAAKNISKGAADVLKIHAESNSTIMLDDFKPNKKYLNEIITKGEVPITSMGSTASPEVARPSRIIDFLRLDGAQVTRPPIDPYRENIDTSFYLAHGRIKIPMPVIIDASSEPEDVRSSLYWASMFTGSVIVDKSYKKGFKKMTILKNGNLLVKNNIRYGPAGGHGLDGFIIFPEKYQELRLSDLDINLKNNGTRYNFDLLVYLNNLRNTGDIIKYLALGADTIILNGGIFTDALNNNYSNLNEKALNFLIVIRRELALIAGAMGVSNLQYSVTGNRELMRGVNLDIDIESRIKVDEAGSL
ncbi:MULTISPECIES: FMN-binding glutamate synthase family protein [Acidiplasma]|uniref:Archaeal glutamate synthase [NADPH] n=2 Tax=Acidiplasma TaxID=507753 RepID=A0A0Q0XM65_9ARCH|nr:MULTISPECIES: FMN-binding glutamate synthase family protein [Acidiplasma]KJE49113.1 glutamate synthase [Acidiplasma sp. MBA-1]KQB36625.1 glutamate synthase [Acidiplasma cupricumulans]WMT54954.1 MAG: glutamate synthase-related protein [Acidiplasma sp.]